MLIHKKSSNVLYMLPVNLYNNDILTKIIESNDINKIILWEHPHFFKRRGYKFNKKKLVLHRASMKSYYDNVLLESSLDKKHISYIDFNKRHTISERKNNICIDPITVIPKFTVKMDKVIDSPNFLMTTTSLKKMNNYHFTQSFYKKVKDHINILTDTKSQDKSNRNVPNIKTVDIPKLSNLNNEKNNYVKEATTYVDKHFKNNYGTTDNFVYPVNHEDARTLAEAAEESPSQLRINVTSPNGTTQAALEVLMDENGGFPALLNRAVGAATSRSVELSRG